MELLRFTDGSRSKAYVEPIAHAVLVHFRAMIEPELLILPTEPHSLARVDQLRKTDLRKHGFIELRALFEIAHRDRDVVDHSFLLAAMAVVLNPDVSHFVV